MMGSYRWRALRPAQVNFTDHIFTTQNNTPTIPQPTTALSIVMSFAHLMSKLTGLNTSSLWQLILDEQIGIFKYRHLKFLLEFIIYW